MENLIRRRLGGAKCLIAGSSFPIQQLPLDVKASRYCHSFTILFFLQQYVFTTHTLVKLFTTIRLDYELVATASTHTPSTPCLILPDCDLIESFAHTHSSTYKLDLCFLQHLFALYYNKSRWASALSMASAPNHHFHYAP